MKTAKLTTSNGFSETISFDSFDTLAANAVSFARFWNASTCVAKAGRKKYTFEA